MSMKGSARSSAKAKARRLTKVTTGKVDASGWTQPRESKTPRMRHAYAAGGKVDKYVGEVEKEAGCKPRGDKRPRKMDGGPLTGANDPRQIANNMMQAAASKAPVGASSPIPTYSSPGQKSPLRDGKFKRGGVVGKPPAITKTKAGTNYPEVPKRIGIAGDDAIKPNTDYGPEGAGKLKKGGRACKADGGATYGRATMNPDTKNARRATDSEQKEIVDKDKAVDACMDKSDKDDPSDCFKKGGRTERKAGGRVKGKTNINIVIAPGGAAPAPAPAMPPMGMHPPGMPPMGPPPAPGAPGAQPPGGAPPNPLAGLPPQLIAQAMGGGGGGQGASMPPSGPPRLPMRAAGGRIMRDGAGGGLGRLEKTEQVAHAKKAGNRGL